MKKATFVEIAPNGRGIGMRFRLEPAHKGATRAFYSTLPGGATVILAADGDYGPRPELDDGTAGILFEGGENAGPVEAFGSFGYAAEGMPAAVRRRVTLAYEVAGTAADSKEAIVARCHGGRYEPKVTIEIVGEEDK